jgi:PEP-CTERM motif
MRRLMTCLSVVVFLALATTSARADDFTAVGYGNTYTWQTPAAPTPIAYIPGYNFGVATIIALNGAPGIPDDIYWFNTSGGGLFLDTDFLLNVHGAQAYSGPESNPVFIPGIYLSPDGYTVTITATPEPSSLILLGTGLLGAVGAVRRRIKA